MISPSPFSRNPRGLHDPRLARDACGVGMICHLRGQKSHRVVADALKILENLAHRGACGCDESTGDGAGILMQMPHQFLRNACEFNLPGEREYGAGLVFLPPDSEQAKRCVELLEGAVVRAGQQVAGWREVPVNSEALGHIAHGAEPVIRQIFVNRDQNAETTADFERGLYLARKMAENAVRDADLPQGGYFHIPSLSCRTLVYKGMFLAHQMGPYFPDLADPAMETGLALVHQRYSTNTFPTWDLAQPFRFLCHNGEINTMRGNTNWMNAREHLFHSDWFGEAVKHLRPVATPGASDSAILDNAVELLCHTGRSLPHAMMMLIPEAWQNHETMSEQRRAFYEYHSCLMEPWDGPASIPFTDGKVFGAVLDRNGLRPSRYTVTTDGFVVMASETGALEIEPERVARKGRLQPGRMFLADTEAGRIVEDEEVKDWMAHRQPYRKWLERNMIRFDRLPAPEKLEAPDPSPPLARQQAFGYSQEDLRLLLTPMARDGKEAVGSMGDDIPLAVLSRRPRLLYDYFRQLFAQVTNPPLDPIREELVTSLVTPLGRERDLFQETADHCRQLRLDEPVLTDRQLAQIREQDHLKVETVSTLFPADADGDGLRDALETIREAAATAVKNGAEILILSDRGVRPEQMPVPMLLAVGAVHHHLIRNGLRTLCGLIAETGEAREVHHFCCLFGYGAGAVAPYLALETIDFLCKNGNIDAAPEKAIAKFVKAAGKGVLKVLAKMGISTLQSYRGAQIFEIVGLADGVVDDYFAGTASRLGGAGLDVIARECKSRHEKAFPPARIPGSDALEIGGKYQWRRGGESHQYSPLMVARFQQAVREESRDAWDEFTAEVERQNREGGEIRGLLEFNDGRATPVLIEEVEPWTEIVKRFKTGAMSYGSISKEAHECLAVAMNRLGGRSNSGEGGEDADRFEPDPGGDWRNSAVKQIASGRFGVTAHYLANAVDLQIKMAQGAKPGEGGQLPGFKVYPWIAHTRHSTPYVGLISPPPHHDIYSIEDLAQLIHDLKCANPRARVNVKLVSEVGVGTVAAGVAKGRADVVLISGHSGGTGASVQTSIRHGGLPWELGLAETQQTLVENGLRTRIRVECDGQLKTGRDVAVACLLGAEEFGFGTISLVALGCIMMRVCHLNTCPVGIATQDPELRKKFTGKPEHVIAMMRFIAEDLRVIMAQLGFRTVEEMVGRVDRLTAIPAADHPKAAGLDLTPILRVPETPEGLLPSCFRPDQDHGLAEKMDHDLIEKAAPALERGERVAVELKIRNIHRTVGTLLSYELSKKYGEAGLPEDTIVVNASGSAGQSFCAFGAPGMTFHIRGDANDYFGKGLSGAKLTIRPPAESTFDPAENILIGNVAFYGATSGEAYINGLAGERFCVRNSGVRAVVEGVGDHGCEYMTGGRAVILGRTGRNFAAGMSGGIAYVLDETGDFAKHRCNMEMVALEAMEDEADVAELRELIERHWRYTESQTARRILDDWEAVLPQFVKVMPTDFKKALERLAREEAAMSA